MFENVRADLRHGMAWNDGHGWKGTLAELLYPGTQAVLVYRFGRWAIQLPIPGLRHVLKLVYFVLQYLVRAVIGVNIPLHAEIGPGLVVHTWSGVYLPGCRIGRNLIVQHGVVIDFSCQEIGDDVIFGTGAKVIKKVRIGSRVSIGANAVVARAVPDDCIVVATLLNSQPTGSGSGRKISSGTCWSSARRRRCGSAVTMATASRSSSAMDRSTW